jgi:hypothetical protein
VLGLLLVIMGYQLAIKVAPGYDPSDPNQPRIKF